MLERVLEVARLHLNMDIAWMSEFAGGDQVFRRVSTGEGALGPVEGSGESLEGSYCVRVLDGRLPPVITDPRHDPRTSTMAVTAALGIGSYIGVPIPRPNGATFGMLCCVSHEPNPHLAARDVKFLEVLATVLGEQVAQARSDDAAKDAQVDQIRHLATHGLAMVFQPIVCLAAERIVGVEALARFAADPPSPEHWFHRADHLGVGAELEVAAVRAALRRLADLPAPMYMSVNVSPASLPTLLPYLSASAVDLTRVVLEVTEHGDIVDYASFTDLLEPLRSRGLRIAVDDTGAGYAGLQHILRLHPDLIKLDRSLVTGLDKDPAARALVRSLVAFSTEIGASLVAEGVETEAEHTTLHALNVALVQGYRFGRPAPLEVATTLTWPCPWASPQRHGATPS